MLLYPYSLHLSYVYKSKRYVHGEIMYITGFFEIFSQIRHFLNVTRYVYGHVMYITQGFFPGYKCINHHLHVCCDGRDVI